MQFEQEQFAFTQRTETLATGPPEVQVGDLRSDGKEVVPVVVGDSDEKAHTTAYWVTLMGSGQQGAPSLGSQANKIFNRHWVISLKW